MTMSGRALICGSLAFDSIMTFQGRFQDQILPDQLHALSTAFEVEQLRQEFGGCAGNIAYSLQALGSQSVVMGTLGKDGDAYLNRLKAWGCETSHVSILNDTYTAQAFITTDRNNNQITAFYPGAMNRCHINHVYDAPLDVQLAIVAPQGYEGMRQHISECGERHLPCLFDPGQGLPLFTADALLETIDRSTWVIVNHYESTILEHTLNLSLQRIAQRVEALIVTKAEHGSEIHLKHGETLLIPAIPAENAVDPTGCGDAYRAGILHGLLQGWSWLKTGRLASLIGSIKIGVYGGQNHVINRTELAYRYHELFQEPLWG